MYQDSSYRTPLLRTALTPLFLPSCRFISFLLTFPPLSIPFSSFHFNRVTKRPQFVSTELHPPTATTVQNNAEVHLTAKFFSFASTLTTYRNRAEVLATSSAFAVDILKKAASTSHTEDLISVLGNPCFDIDLSETIVETAESCCLSVSKLNENLQNMPKP